MNFYTFENTNIKVNKEGQRLYDFFEKTMVNDKEVVYSTYTVPFEFDTRLDLVCKHIYGSLDFMEELMTQNGILNPFSVKTGDEIYYAYSTNELRTLYQRDITINDENKKRILNINNSKTSIDTNSSLPPSIKPDNLNAVNVDYNKKVITIINKFK